MANRDKYCITLAKHISEVTESKIHSTDVSEQLMLIELGMEATDPLIGQYIKETSNTSTS